MNQATAILEIEDMGEMLVLKPVIDLHDLDELEIEGAVDELLEHMDYSGVTDVFLDLHGTGQISTQHQLTNHSCEIDGNTAHTETYFFFVARNRDESVWIAGGRYLARFEKRTGEWKIADRYCVVEWSGTITEGPIPFADIPDVHTNGVPGRDKASPDTEARSGSPSGKALGLQDPRGQRPAGQQIDLRTGVPQIRQHEFVVHQQSPSRHVGRRRFR